VVEIKKNQKNAGFRQEVQTKRQKQIGGIMFMRSFFKKREFPVVQTKTIPNYVLLKRIVDTGFPVDLKNMDVFVDSKYRVPFDEGLNEIISACPSDSYKYVKNARDCEDFVRIFLGWLSQHGYGDLSIGWVRGWLHFKDSKIFHAMCWGVTDENLWIFEPQNDRHKWIWGEPVRLLLANDFEPTRMGI
jgi:hypothetical protein